MARTFRRNDVDAFSDRRDRFASRDTERAMRARIFDDAGLDGEAVASRPLHGAKARREAARALNAAWR
jgi:hypothetical protein